MTRWVVGASVVMWVKVTGAKEAPGASELGRLGTKVAGWVGCTFVSAESTLVRCLDVELTALYVAKGTELMKRLGAMGTFSRSIVGARS